MPPREIFPNPEQIQALRPTNITEPLAENTRARMPFSKKNEPDVRVSGGVEERKTTSHERFYMKKAEESVDAMFQRFGQHDIPRIGMEYVRVLHPASSVTSTQYFLENTEKRPSVDMFSAILLERLNERSLDGVRNFLHVAAHEFIHAKGGNRWTIGVNTTRQTSGFSRALGRFTPKGPQETQFTHSGIFFKAFNEAMTETLAVMACNEIYTSSWFQALQSDNEQKTLEARQAFAREHGVSDGTIASVRVDNEGVVEGGTGYLAEQRFLKLIMTHVSEATMTPFALVMNLFQQDYIEGRMERIKPLLHAAYGPDILRVLSVWNPNQNPENATLLLKYLTEPNPSLRHRHALAYIANHKPLQQKPAKKAT